EIYATIFTIAPSRRDTSTIWTGSDDGVVHVTRDGGRTWRNVTPPNVPPNTRISRIDASWHNAGTAYVAAERHQMNDRAPYIWKTHNYGATWTRITDGLADGDFVRVVREDRERQGLLYAGTEHGVRVSFDDGAHWRSLSRNLPDVQVSDLVVEKRDLVIATHGRSFWILDDLSALRQLTPPMLANDASVPARLLRPATVIGRVAPANVDFYLPSAADSVRIDILDAGGNAVLTLGSAPRDAGLHRVRWDLRYPGASSFPGIVLEGGDPRRGVWAPPGHYRARLAVHTGASVAVDTQPLVLARDPRVATVTDGDLRGQFELARRIRDKESDANGAVVNIRALRAQLREREAAAARQSPSDASRAVARDIARLDSAISEVESSLYQVRNRSPKDKIAFPIRVNDRLTALRGQVDDSYAPPTAAQQRIFLELAAEVDASLAKLAAVYAGDLTRVNESLRRASLPEVGMTFVR
ncbi:MAG TPA: FlgD immunoglobulin-like domain containing protein, partial [Gemmatimonadaceae bacterium]|nr:FlgD immunoglobulin-like domain containing protein [Gemmatimonadaceae bacterium]